MCQQCVVEECLQRDSLCSETGALLSNFRGCAECQSKNRALDALKEVGKCIRTRDEKDDDKDDDGTKEIVKFTHACTFCGHVIANHVHEFWIRDGYQHYRMDCQLCGLGEDSISILPEDPRKASTLVPPEEEDCLGHEPVNG